MTEFIHRPVMLNQCIEGLNIKPDGIYVDGTLGGGGHAWAISQKLEPGGLLIGIDRDGAAIEAAKTRFSQHSKATFLPIRNTHENIRQVLDELSISAVDGFLLDLGVSSYQLDTPNRGFSYRFDSPLDMRMDDRATLTAYNVVNNYSEKELSAIIKNYGEERFAKRISRAICNNRPVKTTSELSEIIKRSVPGGPPSLGHPAARTFQALRIEVNGELSGLAKTIEDMVNLLKPGGRICIITFHSLEDRIVKQSFKYLANPCNCPRDIPYCVCGKIPVLSILTKKPIRPTSDELNENPRSHSAKLRIAQKLLCRTGNNQKML